MIEKREITLTINGRGYGVRIDPRRTLVDAIRDDCGQTGTHIGCEHGVCGACTVLVDGEPVRSCLMFAVQADGRSIETVESLGRTIGPVWGNASLQHYGESTPYISAAAFLLLGVDKESLTVEQGSIAPKGGGKGVSYGQLIGGKQFELSYSKWLVAEALPAKLRRASARARTSSSRSS